MDPERPEDPEKVEDHLSLIGTVWADVGEAHAESAEKARAAQALLLERYGPAIRRYLQGGLRDADAAAELFQEFAVRFIRGDFKNADPGRGRFRDFLKTALYHLIVDYQRKRTRKPVPLTDLGERTEQVAEPAAADASPADHDQDFLNIWRSELLARAWEALAEVEKKTGQPMNTLLRFRAVHPEAHSPEMAQEMSARLNRPVTPEWIRKHLHLARRKFAQLVVMDVKQSLKNPTEEELQQELLELDLLEYCRSALEH